MPEHSYMTLTAEEVKERAEHTIRVIRERREGKNERMREKARGKLQEGSRFFGFGKVTDPTPEQVEAKTEELYNSYWREYPSDYAEKWLHAAMKFRNAAESQSPKALMYITVRDFNNALDWYGR